jgi:hypothetical protein
MKILASGLSSVNLRQRPIGKSPTLSDAKETLDSGPNDRAGGDGSANPSTATQTQPPLAAVDSGAASHIKTRVVVPFNVAMAQGQVVANPLDSLTDSDIKIIEAATDLTEKDGRMYDANGKETYTNKLRDVMMAIFQMRNFGVPDMQRDTMIQVQGDITADQISKYVKFYAYHGGTAFDASTIENIMKCINSEKSTTSYNSASKIKDIINM